MDNLSLRCWLFEDLLVMESQTWTDGLVVETKLGTKEN